MASSCESGSEITLTAKLVMMDAFRQCCKSYSYKCKEHCKTHTEYHASFIMHSIKTRRPLYFYFSYETFNILSCSHTAVLALPELLAWHLVQN